MVYMIFDSFMIHNVSDTTLADAYRVHRDNNERNKIDSNNDKYGERLMKIYPNTSIIPIYFIASIILLRLFGLTTTRSKSGTDSSMITSDIMP